MEIVFTGLLLLGGMKQATRRGDQLVVLQFFFFFSEKFKGYFSCHSSLQLQKQSRFLQH